MDKEHDPSGPSFWDEMKHAEGLIGQHVAAMQHKPIDRKASSGSNWSNLVKASDTNQEK